MLVLALAFVLSVPNELSRAELHDAITDVIEQEKFRDGFWGVVVYSPVRDAFIYRKNGHKNFRPASNMKILTTLLAMEYLGPDYRFETLCFHTGTVTDGVLDGDLLIVGQGDPSLSDNFPEGGLHALDILDILAEAITAQGITCIDGELIGVEGFFDQDMIQVSWEWDDIGQSYGTPVTALSLNDGWIEILLHADETGRPDVTVFPDWIPDYALALDLTHDTDKTDLTVRRDWDSNIVRVSGNLPPCAVAEIEVSAWNPALHFVDMLHGYLSDNGIQVRGTARVATSPIEPDAIPVCSLTSLPLADLAQTLMKSSQNHYADCFLLTTAKRVTGVGEFDSGAELAGELIARTCRSASSENLGFSMLDGSGLSSHNALSPNQILSLLRFGVFSDYRSQWLKTFPVMGLDGTLEKRGAVDDITAGRVWAKTGYIFRSRCLSGYVETLAGEPLIFSMMVNNYSCETKLVNQAQDEICALMIKLKPNRKVRKSPMLHVFSQTAPDASCLTKNRFPKGE